jgi:hypothetical protein
MLRQFIASFSPRRTPHLNSMSYIRRLFVVDDASGSLVGYVDHQSIDRAVMTQHF